MTALLSKRCRLTEIVRGGLVALLLAYPTIGSAYTGSLSSASGGLLGTGRWVDPGPTTIEWVVTQNGDHWTYSYTLSHPRGDTSHFILEVSDSFTEEDLQNPSGDFSSTQLGDYSPGPGNPNMPGDIHGIKFDGAFGLVTHITFDSPRAPVWGDFYAKDGAALNFNTAWNAGFYGDDPSDPIDTDPSDPPSDGSVDRHILVPDTVTVPNEGCCFLDGHCEVQPPDVCLAVQGIPQGPGTLCDPNPCPPPTQACCFPVGNCEILVEGDCIAQGGNPQGEGTDCEPNECPQPPPLGACCFPDGRCEVLTEGECNQVGGNWQGADTDCEPNECPQPPLLGACCFPDGSCRVLSAEECSQAGGVEWTEGANCEEPTPCLPSATQKSTWGQIKVTFR